METNPQGPFLIRTAAWATGQASGRTEKTAVLGETTDDECEVGISTTSGVRGPFLSRHAQKVDGEVRGRTVLTKAQETTDD
jgi:hypothetical protein